MNKTFFRFGNGKTFIATDDITKVRKSRIPYFIFFDKETIKDYFYFSDKMCESPFKCFYLHPKQKGINKLTGRDGSFFIALTAYEDLFDLKENPELETLSKIAREKGYLIFSEEPTRKGLVVNTKNFMCRVFYGFTMNKIIPVSYSPFSDNITEKVKSNRKLEPVLSFGENADFTLAYLDMDKIRVSSNLGKLESFYEIEEMDRLVNGIMGHLQLKDVPLLRDYNNDSLVANYLRRFGHVEKINHIYSHLSASMYDNEMETENGIGVIYDSISYGPGQRIQGSEFVYGKPGEFEVVGRWRPVPLPGGDIANIEPWRITLAVINEVFKGDFTHMKIPFMDKINENEDIKYLIDAIIRGNIGYVMSHSMHNIISSVGELLWYRESTFDMNFFESRIDEVPMEKGNHEYYNMNLYSEDGMEMIDTYDLFKQLIADLFKKGPVDHIVNKVIFSIARSTGDFVENLSKKYNNKKVFLCGEMFKNPVFLTSLTRELESRGLEVYYNRTIPIDDSGISVGQIINYYYGKNAPRMN